MKTSYATRLRANATARAHQRLIRAHRDEYEALYADERRKLHLPALQEYQRRVRP